MHVIYNMFKNINLGMWFWVETKGNKILYDAETQVILNSNHDG